MYPPRGEGRQLRGREFSLKGFTDGWNPKVERFILSDRNPEPAGRLPERYGADQQCSDSAPNRHSDAPGRRSDPTTATCRAVPSLFASLPALDVPPVTARTGCAARRTRRSR